MSSSDNPLTPLDVAAVLFVIALAAAAAAFGPQLLARGGGGADGQASPAALVATATLPLRPTVSPTVPTSPTLTVEAIRTGLAAQDAPPTGTLEVAGSADATGGGVDVGGVDASGAVSETDGPGGAGAGGEGASGASSGSTVEGPVEVPPPFFTFRRPFEEPEEVRPSRFYPYGTTAKGAYLLHHGVDTSNPMGTPVRAVGDGEVAYAGTDLDLRFGATTNFYGNLVVIRHPAQVDGQPLYSLYGHLSQVIATAGQTVFAGDVIGLVGMAGIAMGPHLHLEFRTSPEDYESTRNAELFLAPLPGNGTIVGRLIDSGGQLIAGNDIGLYRVMEDGRSKWVGGMLTYPHEHVNPTTYWGENFLFADTPEGEYTVQTTVQGRGITVPVTVVGGQVMRVGLRAP